MLLALTCSHLKEAEPTVIKSRDFLVLHVRSAKLMLGKHTYHLPVHKGIIPPRKANPNPQLRALRVSSNAPSNLPLRDNLLSLVLWARSAGAVTWLARALARVGTTVALGLVCALNLLHTTTLWARRASTLAWLARTLGSVSTAVASGLASSWNLLHVRGLSIDLGGGNFRVLWAVAASTFSWGTWTLAGVSTAVA